MARRRSKKKELTMSQIKDIVRYRQKGYSQREIARKLGIARSTLQETLYRIEDVLLSPEDVEELCETALREKIRRPRGGARRSKRLPEIDFEYIDREMKRPHVTLELLHQEYQINLAASQDKVNSEEEGETLGYCYSVFCQKYRQWRKSRRTWMRHEHKAGACTFVDYCGSFGEVVDRVTGEVNKVPIFVGVLGCSSLIYVEATPTANLYHWIESHNRMFEFFGGVTKAVTPDNVKTAIKRACRYDPVTNRTYREQSDHCNFDILPARVRKPKDKAKAEVGVKLVQRWILAVIRNEVFYSVYELNRRIWELRDILNAKIMRDYGKSRQQLFEELEKDELQPLPSKRFEFREWKLVKCAPDYHVEFEKNRYSVHYTNVGKQLWIRATVHRIEVFDEGTRISSHQRLYKDSGLGVRYSTLREHMPEAHERVSRWDIPSLLEWAGSIGSSTHIQVTRIVERRKFPSHAIRPVLGLLNLASKHGEQRLESACRWANQHFMLGLHSIKEIIESGVDLLAEAESSRSSADAPSLGSREKESPPNSRKDRTEKHHGNVRGVSYYH